MANRLMISSTVNESLIHVHYPVAYQVVRCIVDRMGYHDEIKDNIDVKTDFHDWTKTTDHNSAAAIRGGSRVRVKLNPNVNPSTVKWEGSGTQRDLTNGNTLIQNQNGSAAASRFPWKHGGHISNRMFSIFRDDEAAIDLSDRMVGTSMSMEVSMEFDDEFEANECLSRVFQCFTNGDMINYVDLMYDVPIPQQFQNLLMYLYNLKCTTPDNPNGNKDENGNFKVQEWYEWLRKYSNDTISILTNRNRFENKELVINKNHFQALYQIDCSQETPHTIDPTGGAITFNVAVQFARSNLVVLEYPIIINNNFIDPAAVPLERKIREAGPETKIMWQNPAYTRLWHETYTRPWPPKPVVFPYYDPWVMPTDCRAWMYNYRPVLIAAFTIDNPEDPNGDTRFDFDTDPETALESKIDPEILKCIKEKKEKVFGVDEFVNITVFSDDIAIRPDGEEKLLDLSDGHTLIIKNRRTQPIYRMVISIKPPEPKHAYHWNRVWICSIFTHTPTKG